MTANSRLTVLVVSFNQFKYVDECLESIYSNSYQSFDVIWLDNGSKDFDELIAEDILLKYPVRKLFLDENIGFPAALNLVLGQINTDYFRVIAADDRMSSDAIEYQIDFLDSNKKYYAVGGSQIKIDEFGNNLPRKSQSNLIDQFVEVDKENIFKNTNIIQSPTVMYRTNTLRELGGYNPQIHIEDLYMYYKAASQGYTIALVNRIFAYYRIHGRNNHSKYLWMYENKIKILNEYSSTQYYEDLSRLILLESFYSLSKDYKKLAMRLIPKVYKSITSKYLYAGLFRLCFLWR